MRLSTAKNLATASKIKNSKLSNGQIDFIRRLVATTDKPTIPMIKLRYPRVTDQKAEKILARAKQLTREISKVIDDSPRDIPGIIYLVVNNSYPGWIKCGRTLDISSRMSSYNTSDPRRGFEIILSKNVKNYIKAEKEVLSKLKRHSELCNGEWFMINKETALDLFNSIT